MEDKRSRQQALSELLRESALGSQAQVVAAMQKLGFEVTQPSISRDFRELGVAKVAGRYVLQREFVAPLASIEQLVVSVEAVGENLVVAKTHTGAANAVAAHIDSIDLQGLVGTLAGDDTIFIAVRDKASQSEVVASLK